ncbi:MAG: sugar phosphate isomerase/epimerase [Bifidobacteriaceae bacterium]|jgi:D-psicose/D-tagatose/L-ribulose 3-epimerase|nr:sugar phosphate isomerase/epimerase [Bifidobacteriaceae bacterium]
MTAAGSLARPLGLSSFALASPMTDADLPRLAWVRSLGYDLVELSYSDPRRLTPKAVRRAAAESGLAVAVAGDFNAERDLAAATPEGRRQGLKYLTACIDFAAQVGATVVAGPMYSAVGKARYVNPAAREREWHWAVEGLQRAADHAADQGVRLALEPLNRFETDMVNTTAQGLQMVADAGRDNLGLSLDTFHMNIEDDNLGAAIRQAGPKIFSFQASENTRGTPGAGHVPWAEVFTALDDIAYGGPVIVEAFRDDIVALGEALCLWRPVAPSMADLAVDASRFLSPFTGHQTN